MKNLLFIVILFSSCEPSVQSFDSASLTGYWLGGGVQLDKGVYKPFNHFMEIDSQLTVRLFSASWRDSLKTIEIKEDSILFPYSKYPRSSVKIVKEVLSLGDFYPFLYKKVKPIFFSRDTIEIKNILLGGQWVSKHQVLEFKDEALIIYDRKTKTKELFCWDIYNFNGIKFLQKNRNFVNCEAPYDALSLVHKLSSDTLEIEMWYNNSFQKLTYRRDKFDLRSFSTADFQLCDPNLYENYRSDWYYFIYPSFEGGLYGLTKVYEKRYKAIKQGEINGLAKLKFVINCKGQVGNIELQTMDFDYKEKQLNPLITTQIIEIFNSAGNWIPAERREEKVDAYKFVVFRIKEGEINEIFP